MNRNCPSYLILIPKLVCVYQPTGLFADLWHSHSDLLGCPLQNEPLITTDSEQRFENGYMLWRKDKDRIYVIYESGEQAGTFQSFDNQWAVGSSSYSCGASPPAGKFQPQMGFGKVWCQLGAANASIGWALTREEMYFDPGKTETDFIVQDFERGIVFRNREGGQGGFAYLLLDEGIFEQVSLTVDILNF